MKVLVVNGLSALLGGGQTNLINLMKALTSHKCNVIFVVNSANFDIFSKFESRNITLFRGDFASKSILHRVFWEIFILPYKLREWGANVYYAPGGIMTTKTSADCVSITTLQNMLPFNDKERQRYPFFSYTRFKLFLLKFVFLKSYGLADKIIFISKYSRDVAIKLRPEIALKSTVIPLGVNDIFRERAKVFDLPDGLVSGEFYLYVSHLDYYKAQKELVLSWKLLVDAGFNYPLVLVGPAVNEYGREVVALIKKLNLQDYVIWLGQIEYEKLPDIYQASRALIFASSCECCPNILLEMLASGKTILCSNYDPMPEFGENGVIYFDPYSSDQLYKTISKIECGVIDTEIIQKTAYKLSAKYSHAEMLGKTIKYLVS